MPRRSSKPPASPAYEAGLRLLARRAHSRFELRRKLARRGYEEDEVEAAVARLIRSGYLNDASFAAGHVRRRSGSLGPLAISAELKGRGVDRRVAGAALEGLDRAAQVEAATRLAERLSGGRRPPGYRELLDAVGAKLLRRGYSLEVARAACRALWEGTPALADN